MPNDRLRIQLLSDAELDRIEETAYTLLDEVGIALKHKLAVEMLHGLGCRVEGERVYIPRRVVEWGLKNVTPHHEFYNRDGSHAFTFGDGPLRFPQRRRPALPLRSRHPRAPPADPARRGRCDPGARCAAERRCDHPVARPHRRPIRVAGGRLDRCDAAQHPETLLGGRHRAAAGRAVRRRDGRRLLRGHGRVSTAPHHVHQRVARQPAALPGRCHIHDHRGRPLGHTV